MPFWMKGLALAAAGGAPPHPDLGSGSIRQMMQEEDAALRPLLHNGELTQIDPAGLFMGRGVEDAEQAENVLHVLVDELLNSVVKQT